MSHLKQVVPEILNVWNGNVKKQGTNAEFKVIIKHRDKKYFLNKTKSYTQKVSELLFIYEGEKPTLKEGEKAEIETLLLYRKEMIQPAKMKNTPQHEVDNYYEDLLYKYFLHEAIGVFGLSCKDLIEREDYSEYDLVKERIKGNPAYKDHVVEALEDGAFYEKGDQFDVFTKLENGWAVYTEHELGKPNNGVAKIDSIKCKVVQETEQKIELLQAKKPTIIMP